MPPRLPFQGSKPIMSFLRKTTTPPLAAPRQNFASTPPAVRLLANLSDESSSSASTAAGSRGRGRGGWGTSRNPTTTRTGTGTGKGAEMASVQNLYNRNRSRGPQFQREEQDRRFEMRRVSDEYLQQMTRNWDDGDIMAPRDLGPTEMRKWRKLYRRKADVVDLTGINPLDHYSNFNLVSEFITPHGDIKHSKMTGLRPRNQRKVAKMVRRAIGLGIHPSVHFHPEILQRSWPKK